MSRHSNNNGHHDDSPLLEELKLKFPLVTELIFSRDDSPDGEELPPFISLLASLTDPAIEGDACVVLPSRERVSASVAMLVALSSVRSSFSQRLEDYAKTGFQSGELVRVLPTGHVFEFGGFFEEFGSFFKLKVIGSKTGEIRSFPIDQIVRLEKTDIGTPKGRGQTDLGERERSELDYLVGTATCGNDALLRNEVLLLTSQAQFLDFMDHVLVARRDNPAIKIPLRNVIPWGVVTPEGDIDFRDSYASGGEPLIAVSPRMEYVALACKRKVLEVPRVVVDGAGRVENSLQAFDDLVEHSKMLVLADHGDAAILPELADRKCDIWMFPNNRERLVGGGVGLLSTFRKAYNNASIYSFKLLEAEFKEVDQIAELLIQAEGRLKSAEAGEEQIKCVSQIYAHLLDFSSLLSFPDSSLEYLKQAIMSTHSALARSRTWMDRAAYEMLSQSINTFLQLLNGCEESVCSSKQILLMDVIGDLRRSGKSAALLADSPRTALAAREFLKEIDSSVDVTTTRELQNKRGMFALILPGWPRARELARTLNGYHAAEIIALAYKFEAQWFSRANSRRKNQFGRWQTTDSDFRRMTGLTSKVTSELPEKVTPAPLENGTLDQIIDLEARFQQLRKGERHFIDHEDQKEAKYVSFRGRAYAYLTSSYKVPDVTRVVERARGERTVLLKSVDELIEGDYVLFRDQSDRDIIRFVAERLSGEDSYNRIRELSGRWREALKKISGDPDEVYEALKAYGLSKTRQTIKNWFNDPEMIGPGAQSDVSFIAEAANDKWLARHAEDVWQAISKIRGAHMTAGFKLSEILAAQLPAQFAEIQGDETSISLSLDGGSIGSAVILVVDGISEKAELAPYSMLNRALWD